MKNNVVKKIGRRKAGTYGKPHKGSRRNANRGARAVLKRVLKGGRSQLVKDED